MLVGSQLLWAILLLAPNAASGHSLRKVGLKSERKAFANREDVSLVNVEPYASEAGPPLSMLDMSAQVAKAGDGNAASMNEGASNPLALSWLFGGNVPGLATSAAQPMVAAMSAAQPLAGTTAQPIIPVPQSPTTLHFIQPPGGMFPSPMPRMQMVPVPPALTVPPPRVRQRDVEDMRKEIAELRQEVASGHQDMWNAVKLITATVEKDEASMQALTEDVQTLRGRHGGSVPLVATECSMRQSSCSECLSVPSCVWCKVEQRCYTGDSLGPVRGECAFFKHGTCG